MPPSQSRRLLGVVTVAVVDSGSRPLDVIQNLDGSPVYAKLCLDCQTARQRAAKAMSEDRRQNLPGWARIIVVQQSREHAS
jgi:hypothetical protein